MKLLQLDLKNSNILKISYSYIKSIAVIMLTVMLLSCSNKISDVEKYSSNNENIGMLGKDLTMIYSDSLVVKMKVNAKEYIRYGEDDEKACEEFPQGVFLESFDEKGLFEASIESQYAKYYGDTDMWEARNAVEVINSEGRKLNTELLFWDRSKEIIFTDKYVKITTPDGQVIEGNKGFKSDQNMQNIELTKISGEIYLSDDK